MKIAIPWPIAVHTKLMQFGASDCGLFALAFAVALAS